MSTSTAYLVPAAYWKKVMDRLNDNAPKIEGGVKDQSGLDGLDAKGGIDANKLLASMAVNMSLASNPKAAYVQHADRALKEVLANKTLTPSEKIQFIQANQRAYNDQRANALAGTTIPSITPKPTPAPKRPALPPRPTPPRATPTTPQGQPGTSGTPTTSQGRPSASYRHQVMDKIIEIPKSSISNADKETNIQTLASSARLSAAVVRELRSGSVYDRPSKKKRN